MSCKGKTLEDVLEEMKNWQLRQLSIMVDKQDEEIADLKETIRQLSLSSDYLKEEMHHFRYAFNYVRNKHNLPPCCTNQDHRGEHPPYFVIESEETNV